MRALEKKGKKLKKAEKKKLEKKKLDKTNILGKVEGELKEKEEEEKEDYPLRRKYSIRKEEM